MNGKPWMLFMLHDNKFLLQNWSGVPFETVDRVRENPPHVNGDTALAKFYRSDLDQSGTVDLTPMPGSPFTKGYFWRVEVGGLVLIVGRYW